MAMCFSFTVEVYEKMPGQSKYILLLNNRSHPKESKKELLESINSVLKLADLKRRDLNER
jgi:hypothetical protein